MPLTCTILIFEARVATQGDLVFVSIPEPVAGRESQSNMYFQAMSFLDAYAPTYLFVFLSLFLFSLPSPS
jgi:hypothetical protein